MASYNAISSFVCLHMKLVRHWLCRYLYMYVCVRGGRPHFVVASMCLLGLISIFVPLRYTLLVKLVLLADGCSPPPPPQHHPQHSPLFLSPSPSPPPLPLPLCLSPPPTTLSVSPSSLRHHSPVADTDVEEQAIITGTDITPFSEISTIIITDMHYKCACNK